MQKKDVRLAELKEVKDDGMEKESGGERKKSQKCGWHGDEGMRRRRRRRQHLNHWSYNIVHTNM